MNEVYLSLGSNEGDKLHHLQQACGLIEQQAGPMVKASGIYKTAAWGNTRQPDFMNQVLYINTSLLPEQLLQALLSIEKKMGRIRNSEKWMQRIIDIDILFYNNEVIHIANLIIPHPYIQQRRFILTPLAEIAPDFLHPLYNKSIQSLLKECTDSLEVKPIK